MTNTSAPLGDSCVHWMHYSEATKARESWAKNLLDEFKSNVEMLKDAVRDRQGPGAGHSSPHHGKQTCGHTVQIVTIVLGVGFCYPSWCRQHIIPCGFSVLQCPLRTMCVSL